METMERLSTSRESEGSMTTRRRILFGLFLLTLSTTVGSAQAQGTLEGRYNVTGSNPDGTSYEGVAEIAKVDGTYRILWMFSDGTSVLGLGIVSNGIFAASYCGGGVPTVAVYKVVGDTLVGEWATGGREGAVYAETLTKTKEAPPPQGLLRL